MDERDYRAMNAKIIELDIPNPLKALGYREFNPSNADNTTAFMRSYKTFTVYAVKHPNRYADEYIISITFGKTEICLPDFHSFGFIEALHNDQLNSIPL